jgi:hypothetical protein
MKRSRFSDEQIIGILKEHQAFGDGALPQVRCERRDILRKPPVEAAFPDRVRA